MKINNNPIMTMPMKMHNQSNVSNTKDIKNQSSSEPKVSGNLRDIVELSMSGRNRSQKLTIPTGKRNTAGLVIKSLKIGGDSGPEGSKSIDKEIVTVSNDRSGVGASENRLGGNTRSIDNPKEGIVFGEVKNSNKDIAKELVDKIRPAMLKESLNTILAQGNTNSNTVFHLLR